MSTDPAATSARESELPQADFSSGRWSIASFVVIVITLLTMGAICSHDFLWWDDQGTIHQNHWLNPPTFASILHFWTAPQWGLYMPVTTSAWALIASVAQVKPDQFDIALNPWFFHAASVVAHLIAALIVLRIFRALNATPFAACCGALLFAVQPLQVESVAWASGLKDVLAGLFSFAAVLQYIHYALARQEHRPWVGRLIAATVFFELAMLSKASAMSLPLTILAIDRWAIGRRWRDVLPPVIAGVALAVPIAIYAVIVQDAQNTPSVALGYRPLIVCDSLAFYLYKLAWPLHLGVDYGRTPAVVIAHGWLWWDWLISAGLAVALWRSRSRRPVLLAAGAIFVTGCLPTLGFTRSLYQFFSTTADHYVYAAMLGPALAVAWVLSIYQSRLLKFSAIVVILGWCALSVRQSRFWQNDYSLFEHSIAVNPNSYISYGNLGSTYARDNQPLRAAALFQTAIGMKPDYNLSWSNLGHALKEAGDVNGAIAADKQSIAVQLKHPNLRPSWERDNWQVGELLLAQKHYPEAERYLRTAAEQDPTNKTLIGLLAEAHHFAATTQSTQR